MGEENLKFTTDTTNFSNGKYEVFEVVDELVFSDERDKIKEYAKKQETDHITYRMSFNNKESAMNIAKEI